jgi:FkbM family methyltransferase
MSHVRLNANSEVSAPPYAQESLLIDAIPEMRGDRILCTSAGLAQFAVAAARALPSAEVSCTYLDLYRANLATKHWPEFPPNLRIECHTDFPEEEVDVAALPFAAAGEAELARDLIQSGHIRLRIGGKLYATTDNRKDKWLREQLAKIFRKLECRQYKRGTLYVGTKTEPLKKTKNLSCEFAFRDRGQLIRAYSRPGVFSHRHIDTGARRLIDEMQIEAGMRVLDIGCGAGTVSLAAAFRGADVTVHAVDSNVRAIQCTKRGMELNGLTNFTTELNATGNFIGTGNYDLALANPPYYASFRIAQHFLIAGRQALRLGGKILVVTKHADWYQQNMPQWFDAVTISERKEYYLIKGVRP